MSPTFLFGIVAAAILLPACTPSIAPGTDDIEGTMPDGCCDAPPDLSPEVDDAASQLPDEVEPDLPGEVAPDLPDEVEPDLPGEDASDVQDVWDDFLEPCQEDGDCASGFCVQLGAGDSVCTVLCDEGTCPDAAWDCVEVEEGEFVCLPPCEPADCAALGAECGAPEDGCGAVLDCGGCGPYAACGDDFTCACTFMACGGGCCAEGDVCQGGLCEPPLCLPSDATCDGLDDDCDGDTDEDYLSDGSCGVGACLTGNLPSECIGGVEIPCQPGVPALDDGSCNNVDDDCDGGTDEDYAADASCGTGWCQESNTASTCVNGVESPCLEGEPLGNDTTCDGVDDDCDGYTDDNFVPAVDCGVGACALGVTPSSCSGGVETPCEPGEPLAETDTTCNGVDEDCDGTADDDYVPDPLCGTGACLDGNTPSSCVDGVENPCAPGDPIGEDVTCDGVDDDCDGGTDEDYVPVTTCGLGVCQITATASICNDGVETPCVPGDPVGEDVTCDGVDDDCDGDADEDAIPPCEFGDPVTGLPVSFTATQGLSGRVVVEDEEGDYHDIVVDLDLPAGPGEAVGLVGSAASQAETFQVVAGIPKTVHLVTSRGTVHEDAATVRVIAEVVDAVGAPISEETEVVFDLEGLGGTEAVPGEALDAGRFAAWLTVPEAAFDGGATGSVTVTAGAASATAPLVAAESPPDLDLNAGRVALLLPLGPVMAGEDFEVPVVVNTGDDALGLYDLAVAFDPLKVQIVGVAPGGAPNLTAPEAGSLDTANALGELSFNGISTDPLAGTPQGAAVEVAVLQLSVVEGLGGESLATFSGTVNELTNTLLTDIRSSTEIVIHDSSGQGDEGGITVRDPALRGIFLRAGDPVMFQDAVLTGEPSSMPLELAGLSENHALAAIDPEDAACLSLSPAVVDAVGCVATAVDAGAATVVAELGGSTASTVVRVVAPALPMDVQVADSNLQYITDLDKMQGTQARVLATYEDGAGLSWTLDVTDQVSFYGSGYILMYPDGTVTALGDGWGLINAKGALGDLLGTASITVSGGEAVSIEQLHVMIPAHLDLAAVGDVPAAQAAADLSLAVTDLFTADGQQAPVLVHAVLSDDAETQRGSRIDVTGLPDLELSSSDPGVGTVEDGVVTAAGSGDALIEAKLDTEISGVLSGSAPLRVQLPPPAGMDVTVQAPKLALGPEDLAATVLGLPAERQIQVIVHFQDGTSLDYTADPSTIYAATSPILQVFNFDPGCPDCPAGQVSASGSGVGTAAVEVSFDDPHLASLSGFVELEVVSHEELEISAWEAYTPPGEEAVPEAVLSYIEGTGVRQKARLRAIELFTDGSSVDVSASEALAWQIYETGTTQPLVGVVSVVDRVAHGVGAGVADLVATLGGHASAPFQLTVDMAEEDLLSLSLEYPDGSTLLGIKDIGTGQLRVTGLFQDGARDLLTGDDLVPGLLAFQADSPHASVDFAGLATVHGNGPVLFIVTVEPDMDAGMDFAAPGVRLLPINLLPDVGDVDLGEIAGLPHPDRDADAVFTMPVRVNTGAAELGGVDLEVTYDPLVLEALDVIAGGGIPGAVFSANASKPGVIYLNASPPPDAGAAGAGVEVAVLTFKALKGGPQVTAVGGTVVAVIDGDEATIGPDTPRPIVAGAGDLDPPPGGVFGDANDDGEFSVGDVAFVRKIKAGAVIPDETQLAQSDIFPDGEVKVSDAYYASQALARLTHFVELSATPVPGGQHFQASLTDRDQLPVEEGVAVRFEVSVSTNLGTVDFTLPHSVTASGVVTAGESAGGGIWETTMTGMTLPEQVGVVVIVDVLGPDDEVVWSTPFLSTPLVDQDAPFTPLLVVEDCLPLSCGDAGLDCGFTLDGCGGILDCGDCDEGETCMGGACIPDGCEPECGGKSCGDDDGCEGICYGPCPFEAQVCVDGACECSGASCDGAFCGDPDGCGGTCTGPCPEPNDECVDGACVCGGTICGENCCGQDELCQEGVCVPSCIPKECGDPGAECGEAPDGCGGVLDCGESCGVYEWCTPDFICDCLIVECEGVCCAPLEQCIDGECGICEPDCDGKQCGDSDGCGDICLACPGENEVCANGTCVCIPDCIGKLCGETDGCGVVCEDAPCAVDWEACVDGECVCLFGECGGTCCDKTEICYGGACCAPDCDEAACGDADGCGGSCDGTCADPYAICQDGACACKYVECAGVCCAFEETCEGGACM